VESQEEILSSLSKEFSICKRCMGRTFGRHKSEGIDITIRHAESLDKEIRSRAVESMDCELCHGIVDIAITRTESLIKSLRDFEFKSFLIGVQLGKSFANADTIFTKRGLDPLLLKFEIARECGVRISEELDKEVEFQNPEMRITLQCRDSKKIHYRIDPAAVYILGKYRKEKRGLPQTKWPCSKCKGRGCVQCNNTGQQYPATVEGIVAKVLVDLSGATDESFHGAGREDIDARMLGEGRPFVLELKKAKRRSIDLVHATERINQSNSVKVSNLQFCEKNVIRQLKTGSASDRKVYRAMCSIENFTEEDKLLVEKLSFPLAIEQRTPQRVSHRRADIIRKKNVFSVEVLSYSTDSVELEIAAQGGTYIKEFISGDEERTRPSITQTLGKSTVCTELDVLVVHDHGLFK